MKNPSEYEYNFEKLNLKVFKDKNVGDLFRAFSWHETPQGYYFWASESTKSELSPEALAIWEDMETRYFAWVEGRIPSEEGVYEASSGGHYSFQRTVELVPCFDGGMLYLDEYLSVSEASPLLDYRKLDQPSKFPHSKFGSLAECANVAFKNRQGGSLFNVDFLFKCEGYGPTKSFLMSLIRLCFDANLNEKDPTKVDLYLNYKDYARDRKTTMKYGRAIRHMCPDIVDSDLEVIVKEHFDSCVKRDYKLIVGGTRDDFSAAYGDNLSKSYNCRTTDARKSLHNSCMRGVEVGGISPAEVYASGDFHIAYLTYGDAGDIAGRVVVRNATEDRQPQAGPVYGVCEHSLNLLEEYLKSINAVMYSDGASWDGAKLLHLEAYGDIIAPYSDMEEAAYLDGDYLVISNGGDISITRTDGLAEDGSRFCCDYCGGSCRDDEAAYVEDYGYVCEHCLEHDFVWSDQEDGYLHHDEAITVFTRQGANTVEEYRHVDCHTVIYCECVDEYWDENDVTPTEDGEDFVPTHRVKDFPELFEQEQEEGEAA